MHKNSHIFFCKALGDLFSEFSYVISLKISDTKGVSFSRL
jgi:hypothetical protein